MVNQAQIARRLALAYAPTRSRAALAALFALDEALGQVVRTTREPLVGAMRLTWWSEALEALDLAPPPAQPVLEAVAREVLSRGVTGASLAGLSDGWEALLDPKPLDHTRLDLHARERGARLFAAAGKVLGAGTVDPMVAAGMGWALADLAVNVSRAEERDGSARQALACFDQMAGARWSRAGRPLGALALGARRALARGGGFAASDAWRMAWLRIAGR